MANAIKLCGASECDANAYFHKALARHEQEGIKSPGQQSNIFFNQMGNRALKKYSLKLVKPNPADRFNPLDPGKDEPALPVLASLKTSKVSHCVVFYKGMIYDSQRAQTMPITQENLDLCCQEGSCHGLNKSWMIIPAAMPYPKKSRRKPIKRGADKVSSTKLPSSCNGSSGFQKPSFSSITSGKKRKFSKVNV